MTDVTAGGAGAGTEFDALLADISATDTFTKSIGQDDVTVGGAAAAGAAAGADGAGAGGTDDDDKTKGAGAGAVDGMVKSMPVTMPDGTVVNAVDGGELVKALLGQMAADRTANLQVARGLAGIVATQSSMMKSMSDQLAVLSNAPGGRRSTVNIADLPGGTAAPTNPALISKALPGESSISGEEFMNKALDAQKAGRITGVQVSEAELYINRGETPPVHIVRAVTAA